RTAPDWSRWARRPRLHPTRQKYGRLSATSGRPPRVQCGNSTLPENLPDVGITATIYRKLKFKEPPRVLHHDLVRLASSSISIVELFQTLIYICALECFPRKSLFSPKTILNNPRMGTVLPTVG